MVVDKTLNMGWCLELEIKKEVFQLADMLVDIIVEEILRDSNQQKEAPEMGVKLI